MDIVERLRQVAAMDLRAGPILAHTLDTAAMAADEIERLRAALETCESWIDRWAKHVGNCEGGDKCTCGRTAVFHEVRAALNQHPE